MIKFIIGIIAVIAGRDGWPVMLVGAFPLAVTYLFLYGFGELGQKNNAALAA